MSDFDEVDINDPVILSGMESKIKFQDFLATKGQANTSVNVPKTTLFGQMYGKYTPLSNQPLPNNSTTTPPAVFTPMSATTATPSTKACFGLFAPNTYACGRCAASQRCRAIMRTDGLEVIAGVLDDLVENLPAGTYADTDKVSQLVDQLITGSSAGDPEPDSDPDDVLSLLS